MLSFILKGCTDCNSLDETICGVDGVLANYGKNAWDNVSYLTNKILPRDKVRMLMYYREILGNLKWDQCFYEPFSYPDIVSRASVLTDGFVPIVKRYILPTFTTTTSTTSTTSSTTTTTTTAVGPA